MEVTTTGRGTSTPSRTLQIVRPKDWADDPLTRFLAMLEEQVVATWVATDSDELDYFGRLLREPLFFDSEKKAKSVGQDERLWQMFFERNAWIFGYGLFYVFTSTLEQKKLEQIVAGTSLDAPGKRVDALLKSRGRISSLCFAEIKTHSTRLLEQAQYRADVWVPSRELAGAIAQVQKTVDRTEQSLGSRLDSRSSDGVPTGETAFLIRPRSIVVAGNLNEFRTDRGINEPQFASFELFRRQLVAPEVLTFDEFYERARFIVESAARDEAG